MAPAGPAVDARGEIHFGCTGAVYRIGSDGLITRFAGTGQSDFSGDGGPATEAQINIGQGIAFDAQENLYIADRGNHRIRKVDTDGIITTIAGTGSDQQTGDDGPAILADVGEVYDVAVDASGNVYFLTRTQGIQDPDDSPRLVRRIDPDGIITTVAGDGTLNGSIDGVPATEAKLLGGWLHIEVDSRRDLYISEPSGHRVRKVTFDP